MMDVYELAGKVFGRKRAESGASGRPRDLTVSGTATSDSQDGLVSIVLDGDMTQAEDDGLEHDGSILVPTDVGVQEGDEVAVTMTGSDVSTVRVTGVVGNGDRQNAAIAAAQTVANAAQTVANAINQHFFADTNGIHVTEATQEDWDENHTGANVLINSIGQLFRDGLNNLLTLTTEDGARALTIWDGLGNAAENVRARFSSDEISLGKQLVMQAKDASEEFIAPYEREDQYIDLTLTATPVSIDSVMVNGTPIPEASYTLMDDYRLRIWDVDYSLGIEGGDSIVVTYLPSPTITMLDGTEDEAPIARFSSGGVELADGSYQLTAKSDTYSKQGSVTMDDGEGETASVYLNTDSLNGRAYVSIDVDSPNGYAAIILDTEDRKLDLNYIEHISLNHINISTEIASVSLRSPIGTYTGTNSTATASANGWQLTWFNTVVAEVGSPRTYDYSFSNGVLTAQRDCVLEISGVMNWTDAIAGNRGFGIFEGTTAGSGTEHSAFQSFAANLTGNRKSVIFPPKLFALSAGSSLTFGRYQQANAVYQNGTNYSWVTIRVVG